VYEQAIRSARANGFVHNEALANELASRFYAARGFVKIARLYLQDARYGYLRWGADGKVRSSATIRMGIRIASSVDVPRRGCHCLARMFPVISSECSQKSSSSIHWDVEVTGCEA
jgi:hypothetical protein